MQDGSKAVTRNPATPAAPRPPSGAYAPGPIREASDAERSAVAQFTARHPEYSGLAPEIIAQAMSTYRTDEEDAERAKLRAEGVPEGWRPFEDDETTESLGRF
jgi:hypothetical protein